MSPPALPRSDPASPLSQNPLRTHAPAAPNWSRAGALFVVVTTVLLTSGCGRDRKSMSAVPAASGGVCRVRVGDRRVEVRIRCGAPCHVGEVKQGKCSDWSDGCPNTCEIYHDIEVCYAGDRVATLRQVDREWGRFEWCYWPQPIAPEPR